MDIYKKRLASLKDEIRKRELDSFLVTSEANVSYLSGFQGSDSLIIVTDRESFFITDSRYVEEVYNEVTGFTVQLVKTTTYKTIDDIVKGRGLKRMGFESMNLPYEVANRLTESIARDKFVPVKSLVEALRSVKDEVEIRLIKKSIRLAKTVFDKLMDFIKPGMSEMALCDWIELEMIKLGGRPGFKPIVASGENASKPHARPTPAKLSKNSFVMIDLGCSLNGYNSDYTRTIILGKVKDKFKKIYNIVHRAQEKALARIRPGVKISDVDHAARGYIEEKGFGKYFDHSLGHGVGLEVHEEPTISKLNNDTLKAGMVFTVEPAIYIPKFGGVRVEDMVLVTPRGCEALTI